MAKTLLARVLCDIAHLGLLAEDLVEGPESVIKDLASSGQVDPHPDAVAYAKATEARRQTLPEQAPPAPKKPKAAAPADGDDGKAATPAPAPTGDGGLSASAAAASEA
jgi:hypothetical protein